MTPQDVQAVLDDRQMLHQVVRNAFPTGRRDVVTTLQALIDTLEGRDRIDARSAQDEELRGR